MSEWYRRMPSRTRRSLLFGGLALLVLLALVGSTLNRTSEVYEASAMRSTREAQHGFGGAAGAMFKRGTPPAAPMPDARQAAASLASGFDGQVVPAATASTSLPWNGAMLIRSASLRVRVKDVSQAYANVVAIAQLSGGYLSSSTMNAESTESGATVIVRVPNAGLDSALDRIASLGKLLGRQVQSQEVTEEYVDLSSRLRNLQREELRLLDFMNRAGKIPDLLTVEQEVARVRGEIETVSGRLRYLKSRVDLSSIEVQLLGPAAKIVAPAPKKPEWAAIKVVKEAYVSLRNTARGLATVAIWLGLYLPLWLPLTLGVTWVVKRELRHPSE